MTLKSKVDLRPTFLSSQMTLMIEVLHLLSLCLIISAQVQSSLFLS